MGYWLEVISGRWRYNQKMDTDSSIYAPKKSRYLHIMKHLKNGDKVLTYIASHGSPKDIRSSIFGFSEITSDMILTKTKIIFKTTSLKNLPVPIKLSELSSLSDKSPSFKTLLRKSMQAYVTQITEEDFHSIMKLHRENYDYIKNH